AGGQNDAVSDRSELVDEIPVDWRTGIDQRKLGVLVPETDDDAVGLGDGNAVADRSALRRRRILRDRKRRCVDALVVELDRARDAVNRPVRLAEGESDR